MVTNVPNNHRFSATLDAWLNNLAKTGRSRKQMFSMFIDAALSVIALWSAYSLRYGEPFSNFGATWFLFLALPVASVLLFMAMGIYRWVVRSSNRHLYRQLVKACIASAIILAIMSFMLPPEISRPRSVFTIYFMLLVLSTCGIRAVWQALFQSVNRGEPVAVYGAGAAGRQLVSMLGQASEYRPIAFIDDSPHLTGTTIAGLPVVDGLNPDLDIQLRNLEIERIILAMPSLATDIYEQKLNRLKNIGMPVQTVPTINELVTGTATPDQVRDVEITDLLGRSVVPPDMSLISKCVTGKVVLVTGAGGSIGSELCRQILNLSPKLLIALDHSENNLYNAHNAFQDLLKQDGSNTELIPVLCSVMDEARLDEVMEYHNVNTVYHAAAYKHVPIIEDQPEQGAKVNVFGTMNVLDAAIKRRVENFVLISTDKAVRPTNAMGASKRTAELVLQAKARQSSHTIISMVRFGNVLDSSGSVVPKFREQIQAGGPITLTHPEVTRYFMTIPEAAQLVLQASAIATGGDVFVLDMGEPVKIQLLAEKMVQLMGRELQSKTGNANDIELKITGLRPGEKMFEELFVGDNFQQTTVSKVYTADETFLEWEALSPKLEVLRQLNKASDRPELRKQLLKLAFSGQSDTQKVGCSESIKESIKTKLTTAADVA